MQIEIKLDESCKEPKIIIHTDKMTEEVSQIVKLLSEEKPEVLAAVHENGEIVLLEQTEKYGSMQKMTGYMQRQKTAATG